MPTMPTTTRCYLWACVVAIHYYSTRSDHACSLVIGEINACSAGCLVKDPQFNCEVRRLLEAVDKEWTLLPGVGPAAKEFYKWGGRLEMMDMLASTATWQMDVLQQWPALHAGAAVALVIDGLLLNLGVNKVALSPIAVGLWLYPWLYALATSQAVLTLVAYVLPQSEADGEVGATASLWAAALLVLMVVIDVRDLRTAYRGSMRG